jgi:hypothetical protein
MSTLYTKNLAILCLSFSFSALYAQDGKIDSSQMVNIRIDPGAARGTPVSKVFEEIEFIPLETTKESLFGKVKQLEIAENCFIIFDEDTKSIFIFDKTGKFKSKINEGKIVSNVDKKEPSGFYEFQLKKENGITLIQVNTKKLSIYFDLGGNLIKKAPVNKEIFNVAYSFPESEMPIKLNQLKSKADSSYFEVAIFNKKNQQVAGFFPFQISKILNDDLISSGKRFFNYGVLNELFYTRYFENNIYKITPTDAILAYQIVLPEKNSLPKNFIENPIYKGRRMEYFQKNKDKYYGIFNTYLFGNSLFFNFSSFGYKDRAFLYKLKESQLISMADLEPDELSSFLPVTDLGILDEFKNRGFNLYQDGYLYNSYSSLAMFTLKEQTAGKNIKYNKILTEYFKTQNKNSNPVIIRLKPKSD